MLEFSDLVVVERVKASVTNGRTFNVLMFVLILAIAVHFDRDAVWVAFAPVLSIGAAYLADGPGARFQPALSIASIAFAVASFLIVFYI